MSKNSKHLARISLAIMGTGFAATIPFQGSFPAALLQGGFEAGIVGGLADWFAVTALFRHPLGLPIPHTALLPKNRKRMTKAIVSTIENDWLSKESIQDKLKQIRFTEKLLPILETELHSDYLKKGIQSLFKEMIDQVDIERLTPLFEKYAKEYLSSIEIKNLFESVADQFLERQYDERALDYLLVKAEDWINAENRRFQLGSFALSAIDNIQVDGFLQFALKSFQNMVNEEKIGKIIQNLLRSKIVSLRQPNNLDREDLLRGIRTEIKTIKDDKNLLVELENMKEQLIASWNATKSIQNILQTAQQKLLAFSQDSTFVETYILPYLTRLLNHFKNDAAKISAIENWIQKQFSLLIEENHSKIGKLVQENLDKLNDETLIDMVENNIGKDLQWIRVNGAVCGFVIGILITGIKSLF